jgi:phosphohistidine phosphatase SixA
MKKLFIIRHAKSSWLTATVNDFDRPLNERV